MNDLPNRVATAGDSALVFAAALGFYWVTAAPTVVWGDSAALAVDAFLGLVHIATAGDHPFFIAIGHLCSRLPGDVARNLNLEAAVFGALAVMFAYRGARALATSRLAAATGAAALAVSHAFWLHSVIAEVYTANAFFAAATLTLLLEWRRRRHWLGLAASAAVFAVGLTNHLVLATMAPAAVVFIVLTEGRALMTRRVLAAAVLTLAIIAVAVVARRDSALAMFRVVWYGPPGIGEYLGLHIAPIETAREAGYYVLYLVYQFPSVSLLLGTLGAAVLFRQQRSAATLLLLMVAVNAFTFVRHTVWPSLGNEKFVFYIVDYLVFSILCAVGADAVVRRAALRWPAQARLCALGLFVAVVTVPPVVYAVMPSLTAAAGIDLVHARNLPYRDNARFFLNPNKRGEDGPRRYATEAFAQMKPNAVIFADYTPYTVLRYLQVVEKQRLDVRLAAPRTVGGTVPVQWILGADGRPRPTYLAALTPGYYDLTGLTGEYDLAAAGPIFEVRAR